jgi:hypothetical protein
VGFDVSQTPEIALLDSHLEVLLDMTIEQRAARLDEIGRTDPTWRRCSAAC